MKFSEALKILRDNPESRIITMGICPNLDRIYNPENTEKKHIEKNKFIRSAFTMIYGKNESFPIGNGYSDYYLSKDKWDSNTAYGRERLELLDKLIIFAEASENLADGISMDMLDFSDLYGIPVPDSNGDLVWCKTI